MTNATAGWDLEDPELVELLARSEDSAVLLYFTVEWCVPCREFGPRVDDFRRRRPGLEVRRVDCEAAPTIADHFDVQAYPTLAIVRHGEVQWTAAGAMPDHELIPRLDVIIDAANTLPKADSHPSPSATATTQPRIIAVPEVPPTLARVEIIDHGPESTTTHTAPPGTHMLSVDQTLRLFVQADPRSGEELAPEMISAMPGTEYELIVLEARRLTAATLRAIRGLPTDTLALATLEPLAADALEVLVDLPAQALLLRIPGIDTEQLIRRVPGVPVNNSALSPGLAAALPEPPARITPTWTSIEEFETLVRRGDRFVALTQAAHLADIEGATAWHAAVTHGGLEDVISVSVFGSTWCERLLLDNRRPAIVLFEAGEPVWRRDLPDDPARIRTAVAEARLTTNTQPIPPTRALPERTVPEPPTGASTLHLLPPGTGSIGAPLHGRDELIPAGWRVLARVPGQEALTTSLSMLARASVQHLVYGGAIDDDWLTECTRLATVDTLELFLDDTPTPELVRQLRDVFPHLVSMRTTPPLPAAARAALTGIVTDGQYEEGPRS